MNERTLWNRALTLSIFFHLAVVPCLGLFFNSYLTVPPQIEKHIELELIKYASPKPIDNGQSPGPKNEISQPPKQEQIPEQKPPVAKPVKDKPVNTRKIEPIAKDDTAIIDKTVQSIAESSGEKSANDNNKQAEASNSGQNSSSVPASGSGQRGQAGKTGQSGEYIRPQLLSKVEPAYPEKARAASREGTVSVSLEVLNNGKVGSVTIRKSSGHTDLDEAAMKAVKSWRFVPAKDNLSGQPITCFVNFPVVFKLK